MSHYSWNQPNDPITLNGHAATFDEFISANQIGRVFSPIPPEISPYFDATRSLANQLISDARINNSIRDMPSVYFDFVDSFDLNAVAFSFKNQDFIGLHNGTVFLLRDTFGRMMSHPKILPDFGDAKDERITEWHTEGTASNFADILRPRLLRGRKVDYRAKDPFRDSIAIEFAAIASHFVLAHEIAHISHGHLRYLNATTGSSGLLEITNTDDLKLAPLTRQAIEMDADSSACEKTLKLVLMFGAASAHAPAELTNMKRLFPNVEQAIFVWAFSIAGLFHLWGLRLKETDPAGALYPPTAIRLMMVLATGAQHIKFLNQNGFKTVPDDKYQMITALAVAALQLSFTEIGWGYGRESLNALTDISTRPDLFAYQLRIHQQWTRIRPYLVKYSYFQNLAP